MQAERLATFLHSCLAILQTMGESGKIVWRHSKTKTDPLERVRYLKQAIEHLREKAAENAEGKYSDLPVDVITFIESKLLLDMGDEIFPKVKDEIADLCSGKYIEAVLTGGIGTGKTTIALVATAYTLYQLACLREPQREFGLARSSEIVFIFQSLNAKLSKAVDFDRFKAMLDNSAFFQELFRYDRNITSELRFPNRIIVKPLSGDVAAAIGQNVFGGVMDEVNFMAVTENSKMAGADGGTFDQAREMYNSISRRRESRFMKAGKLFGMLCLVSSKQYPGEFTDRKMQEAKDQEGRYGFTTIFVYDKRVWEVKPIEEFTGEWFYVFLGDPNRKPRILEPNEELTFSTEDRPLIMPVPVEFRKAFEVDLLAAIRDIAGMTTLALHPFIINVEALRACFGIVQGVLSLDQTDFYTTRPLLYPRRFVRPNEPRFAHIDLGLTRDSLGLAVGHVVTFIEMDRGGESEILPVIQYDCLLEVVPPRNGEIEIENARRVLYALRDAGMLLKWVSFDSFQSKDSMQILAGKGFTVGYCSVDTDNAPYEVAKQAFYDGRVRAPYHSTALTEWTRLERNEKTKKIDHPPNGSKDVSDAMAGVAYGLTMRREIWQRHGVPLYRTPKSLLKLKDEGTMAPDAYVEKLRRERYAEAIRR